jgi:hypothetical protein
MKQTQLNSFLQALLTAKLHETFAIVVVDPFCMSGKNIELNAPAGRSVVQNPGGPLDLTPTDDTTMTQLDYVCTTSKSCLTSELHLQAII